MEPESKKINLTRLFITLGIVLFAALAIGGSTYYVMSSNAKKEKEATDKQTAEMQKQINDLQKAKEKKAEPTTTASAQSCPSTTSDLTDADYLNVLTINKPGFVKTNSYVAPAILGKEGDWARTSPVPVQFNQTNGYSIPGMGGIDYVWHKVNGKWTFVGQGGEGGYDNAVKALYSQIPTSVIPSSQR